ncbi:MAG: Smr/MutS family protein [Rubrivivax sp.]|nr:Smr/MutS family protein [Rubrivivax sp.]
MAGFAELGAALKQQARAQAEARAAQEAQARARRSAQQQRQREEQAFALAVGPVTRLPDRRLATLNKPLPAPEPFQRQKDEQAALKAALSDEVDVESLLLTDDGLSFRRPGVAADVLTRLRKGHWAIQRQIDLHGLRRDEAREALATFLRQTRQQGHRCLRVVHGKGLGSPGREPVLKGKVQRWLAQSDDVIAFAQASAPQGGAGAVIVLLDA